MMKRILLGASLTLATLAAALAQPGNVCGTAQTLTVGPRCDNNRVDATTTGYSRSTVGSTCAPFNRSPDRWFKFVATKPGANVRVEAPASSTIAAVQFDLFGGTCGNLVSLGCGRNPIGISISSFARADLTVGQTYYVRVFGGNRADGTSSDGEFNICVRSFDPAPFQVGDCVEGAILCGTPARIKVGPLNGAGDDLDEVSPVSCFEGVETNSVWYRFTAANAGELAFVLTPDKPDGDLDFAVYFLGFEGPDCADKQSVRCVAAGGAGCTGPTGMRRGEPDDVEGSGCGGGNNGFVSTYQLFAGASYAILINEYDALGDGFTIDWTGNTAVFTSPDPGFTSTVLDNSCTSIRYQFTATQPDFVYAWDFGPNATPRTSTERSPVVSFSQGGPTAVTLEVQSLNCSDAETQTILIGAGAGTAPSIISESTSDGCGSDEYRFAIDGPSPTATYTWDFGAAATPRTQVGPGPFVVKYGTQGSTTARVVATEGTCTGTGEKTVEHSPRVPFEIVLLGVDSVNCTSPNSGGIRVTTNRPDQPFSYSINAGPAQSTGTFTGLGAQTYTIVVRPAATDLACAAKTATYTVGRTRDGVTITGVDVTPTSCPNLDDGTATVRTGSRGSTFQLLGQGTVQTDSVFGGLAAGSYTVAVTNARGCRAERAFTIERTPSTLSAPPVVTQANCAAGEDGVVTLPLGGSTYVLGGNTLSDNVARGLAPGTYAYSISQTSGCRYDGEVTVGFGNEGFRLGTVTVSPASCAVAKDGELRLVGVEGVDYTFADRTIPSQSTESALAPGVYTLSAVNAEGCTKDTTIVIGAGAGPTVSLGPDLRARFGDTVLILPTFTGGRAPIDSFRYGGIDSTPTLLATLGGLRFVPNRSPQVVTLTVVDGAGCSATDELEIEVRVQEFFQAPSAFSPNGDDTNDLFVLRSGPEVARIEQLSIYDRWGGLLFNLNDFPPNDPSFGWDGSAEGRQLDTGVYVYTARVAFVNGAVKVFSGGVHLMR